MLHVLRSYSIDPPIPPSSHAAEVTLMMHSALSMAHLEMISTLHNLSFLLLYFPVAPARAFYILVSVPNIAPSGSDMYYYCPIVG